MITNQQPQMTSPHLVRQLSLGSGIAVVVGSMIGSGIFRSPADIAVKLPGPLPILIVWMVGGLFALCGALTLSEVGGAYPYSGGIYVFIREAYGRLAAFMYGWTNLLLTPASNGAVAIVFSQYALRLFGMRPGQPGFAAISAWVAIGAIVAVTMANVLGVKFGAGIQNLTTIAKVSGLVALIILALVLAVPHSASHFIPAIPGGSFTFSMFGLALVSVLFACDGWMNVACVGGEMLNPRRNVPRAIVLGVLIVVIIYVVVNIAYISVFTVPEISKSQIIAADTMSKLIGAGGVTFIVATVMLSTFGALNAGVFTAPRVYFAMAEDKLMFEPISRVHPKYRTPYVSVIVSGIQGIFYIVLATKLSGDKAFGALIDACVIGNLPFLGLAVGSIFVFRKRENLRNANAKTSIKEIPDSLLDSHLVSGRKSQYYEYNPPVRTPMYPLPPLLFIASVMLLICDSLFNDLSRGPSLIVLAALSSGFPIYYFTVGRKSQ